MAGVSVMIVNYNGASFIPECIDSVLASELNVPLEVIVVDNASQDNSKEVLDTYADKVKVVYSLDNLGFSRGNNLASEHASGDFLFLLNNDTVLLKTTLQSLVDFMKEHPEAGAITPKLLNEDGSLQCPGSIFGRWRFWSKTPIEVPFIAGAAVMMHASLYKEMGGLDGNLFFYNDDIDMCMTLKKLMRPIYYVPTAELTHYGGLSTRSRKLGSLMEGYRGGLYVAYKHYPRFVYHTYRVLVMFDILPRLTVYAILSLFSSKARQYAKVYVDIIRINWSQSIFLEI